MFQDENGRHFIVPPRHFLKFTDKSEFKTRTEHILPSRLVPGSWQSPTGRRTAANTLILRSVAPNPSLILLADIK